MLGLTRRFSGLDWSFNKEWVWSVPLCVMALVASVFIIGAKPGQALAFTLGPAFMFLAFLRYDLALYLWIATAAMLPISDVELFHIPVLGSMGLYPVQILLIVLLGVGVLRSLLSRDFQSFRLSSIDIPLLLLIVWAFLSLVVNHMRGTPSGSPVRQLLAVSLIIFSCGMYFVISRFAITRQRAMGIIVSIFIVGIYNFAWHIFHFVAGGGAIGYLSRVVPYMWVGPIGLIYLVYGALSLALFLYWEKVGWLRWVFLLLFLTSLVGTVANYSRWFFVCYGIMLATILLLKVYRSRRWLMVIVASLALGLMVVNIQVGLERVQVKATDSFMNAFWELEALGSLEEHPRVTKVNTAVDIWSRHPVFGVGPGNYEPNDPRGYLKFPGKSVRYYGSAHHLFFQMLAELGAVGALLFLWFLFVVGKETGAFMRSARDDLSKAFGVAAFAAWVGLLLGGGAYFSDPESWPQLNLTVLVYSWALIGVVMGLKQHQERKKIGPAQ